MISLLVLKKSGTGTALLRVMDDLLLAPDAGKSSLLVLLDLSADLTLWISEFY